VLPLVMVGILLHLLPFLKESEHREKNEVRLPHRCARTSVSAQDGLRFKPY
jgi:hypothetical protein